MYTWAPPTDWLALLGIRFLSSTHIGVSWQIISLIACRGLAYFMGILLRIFQPVANARVRAHLLVEA